jgi:CubicO group peptidase (beta-lactamase class C family)
MGLACAGQDPAAATERATYFPPRGTWEVRAPASVGLNPALLSAAVAFAQEQESDTPEDLAEYIRTTLANEPHGEIIGPTRKRGRTHGVIIRRGYVVATFGPVDRVDMTFSVSKTYLSTVVGLAVDRGLIRKVSDPVAPYLPTDECDSDHGRKITWDHLLRQTSDWRGSLWDKPDWADRPPRGATLEEMQQIPLREPGSAFEYNDVRVNLLALAALHVWRRPLPEVLRELVMDPIGASNTWRWHGYTNSWVTLDGSRMQSVSGGGHWGGGMFINTWDHARFGYLFLREGRWEGKRIISPEWIAAARTPTGANPGYGYMNWFLNGSTIRRGAPRRPLPSAPETSVTFQGAGANIVYIDWEHDLVAVFRWIRNGQLDAIIQRVLAAIEE